MSFYDRIMLRKRSIIETMNDELKNICEIEHTRHRYMHNFIMNLITAYCFFDKKPAIRFDMEKPTGQLVLFYYTKEQRIRVGTMLKRNSGYQVHFDNTLS